MTRAALEDKLAMAYLRGWNDARALDGDADHAVINRTFALGVKAAVRRILEERKPARRAW